MRRTVKEFRQAGNRAASALRGLIRRLTVVRTAAAAAWQVAGIVGAYDEQEAFDADMFAGVGIAYRPPAGADVEAVVLHVGSSSSQPVIVGTRVPALIPDDLAEDETVVFNSAAIIRIRPDGTVTVTDRVAGVALPLARLADLVALRAAITAWVPAGTLADAGNLKAAILAASWTTGTSKLKGQ